MRLVFFHIAFVPADNAALIYGTEIRTEKCVLLEIVEVIELLKPILASSSTLPMVIGLRICIEFVIVWALLKHINW